MAHALITDDDPVDPDDERLVAYLDGELEPSARTLLEQELVDDAALRGRLQDLQRGWDYLDSLPDCTPNEKLVETTIQMVVADVLPVPPSRRRFASPAAIGKLLLACAVAAAVGVGLVKVYQADQFQQQLRDVAIAIDLNAYLDGGDLELMRTLRDNEEWQRLIRTANSIQRIRPGGIEALPAMPIQQRAAAIAALPPDDVSVLATRWDRFRMLSPEYRERVFDVAERLASQDDAASLLQTMRDYSAWKSDLPDELIDAIQADGSASLTRQEAIRRGIAQTLDRMQDRSGKLLSEPTMDQIRFALQYLLRERLKDPRSAEANNRDLIIQFTRQFRGTPPEKDEVENRLIQAMVDGPRSQRQGGSRFRRPEPLSESELNVIEWMLPDDALDLLESLSMGKPMMHQSILRVWAAETARRDAETVQQSSLERYQQLSDTERAALDLAPPEEIRQRLSRDPRRFWGRRDRDPDRESSPRNTEPATDESSMPEATR